jgi:NAD(P)-dependent dehydrogenase (short-subunit alcohol dehydrogenase family)
MGKGHRDKVAVITGAANGIGQAFAKRLAEDGVHIAIADLGPAEATVKLVEQAGRDALACRCDVTSPDAVAALAREVERRFGRCDILINCAGIFPPQPFDQMPYADWRRVLSINLDSLFLVSAAFVPGMKQRGWGRIVNMASSTLGSVVTGFVHYVASKGGVVGFTRALATELGPHGITVNAIAPGLRRGRWRVVRARASRAWTRNSPRSPPCRRSSAARCPRTWSGPCRSSPATMPPSSPGRPSTWMAAGSAAEPARLGHQRSIRGGAATGCVSLRACPGRVLSIIGHARTFGQAADRPRRGGSDAKRRPEHFF